MAIRNRRSTASSETPSTDLAAGPIDGIGNPSGEEGENAVRLHGSWRSADREARIAARAYELAQARDFDPGHDLDDWLEAERQIDIEEDSRQGAE